MPDNPHGSRVPRAPLPSSSLLRIDSAFSANAVQLCPHRIVGGADLLTLGDGPTKSRADRFSDHLTVSFREACTKFTNP